MFHRVRLPELARKSNGSPGAKLERVAVPAAKMNGRSWDWPGSRWWRVDCHAHSPASYDFKEANEKDDKQRWVKWITAARDAKLDAIAITDHNTAAGIEPLQEACLHVENAPVLFPGVEITASNGCHLLVIMDPKKKRDHINEFLSRVGIPPDDYGKQRAGSPKSIEDILNECDDNTLILGAHVNGKDAGILKNTGREIIAVLNHSRLAGVEVVPDICPDDEKFLAPEEYEPWLDGSKEVVKRQFQPVWSSDAHRFADLGRRWTWFKMASPTLEGLRLALLDGAGSVKPSQNEDYNPNTIPDLAIESITVSKGKFIGRPEKITIPLNPYLNTIIGGRGTGKSTIVDFCRMTLRRQAELENTRKGEESLKNLFDRRMRVPQDRKEEGLLTKQTTAEVIYRKNGQRFRLSWSIDGSIHPVARVNEQDHNSIELEEGSDIRERFPMRIYSQKQLFTLAQNPNALLSVIDDSIRSCGSEIKQKIEKFTNDYLSLCAHARAALQQAENISTHEISLKDIRHKINVLQAGNQAQVMKRYQLLHTKDSSWQKILNEAKDSINSLKLSVDELAVADLTENAGEDDQAQISLQRAHRLIKQIVNKLRQDLKQKIDFAQNHIKEIEKSDDVKCWQDAVILAQNELEEIMENLMKENIKNPNEYSDLLRSAESLEKKIQDCKNQRNLAEKLEREADKTLINYRNSHTEMNKLRHAFLSELLSKSENLVKIKVNQFSNYNDDDLKDEMSEIMGINKNTFDEDRKEMIKKIKPDEGKPWDWKNLDELINGLRKLSSQPSASWSLWKIQNKRFLGTLQKLPPERVDRLALYCPGDEVEVEFKERRDGSWKSLQQGSPGQQAAALLAFILGHGKEPIMIDQPEDDLDNALIYELLVHRLREVKQDRQVIVVTHNPNIVVNGNAELVLSLKVSKTTQVGVGCQSGLQEQDVRDEICSIMEGGREALERRYQWILLPERSNHAGY